MAFPDRLAIASRNAHKLRELGRICADWPVEWVTVDNHDPSAVPRRRGDGRDLPRQRRAEGDPGRAGARHRGHRRRLGHRGRRARRRARATVGPLRRGARHRRAEPRRHCCARCGACRRVGAPPGTDASPPSRGPTGAPHTPTARARGPSCRSVGARGGSATTPSSCPPAGTRRWPSSPTTRRTASAIGAGRSARCATMLAEG